MGAGGLVLGSQEANAGASSLALGKALGDWQNQRRSLLCRGVGKMVCR